VARAMGALVLNKLLALYGGAGSLTQLAQFQNLMGLFGALPADGIQVGATTRLAPLLPGARRYRAWLGAAAGLTLGAVGLGGVVLGQRRAYVWQAVALSVAGTAAAGGALLLHQPLPVVLGCYLGGQALVLLPTLVQARRASLLQGLRVGWPSRPAVRGLLRFVLMASGPLVFGRAVDYAVRAHLMAYYPPASTDLWQAVARLSDHYSLVVGAVLSTVFYPQLAALAVVPAQARHYLRVVLALLAAGVGGGLGVVFVLRDWLLPLLFAPRLLAARELLAPQLLGDWAKFLVWVFLYQLLARARPLPYLAVQAASAVLYTALLVGLLPHLGLSGVVWAHAGRYGMLLLVCSFIHLANKKIP
jgi:PST family polysaccharide transporter